MNTKLDKYIEGMRVHLLDDVLKPAEFSRDELEYAVAYSAGQLEKYQILFDCAMRINKKIAIEAIAMANEAFDEGAEATKDDAENTILSAVLNMAAKRRDSGRDSANKGHDKPGGYREKRNAIRASWASGNFTSRDKCAKHECDSLGIAFSTARRHLNNTLDPERSTT